MSKKSLVLLISLMSIALIGISAFQVYWINSVIQLSQERFEKDVLASMQIVAERLERNEMVNVATNSFAFFGSTTDGETDNIQIREEIHLSSSDDSISGKFWYRSNANNQVKVIVRRDSAGEIHEFVQDTSLASVEITITDEQGSDVDVVAKRINSKQKVLTKVVEQMMFYESKQTNRVHPVIIDSLLHQEFNNHGIHIRYEFGIYDTKNKNFRLLKAEKEDNLTSSALKASLFPNDILNNGLALVVNFPNKNKFLLEKVWLSLLISLLFIITIISVFAYVVYKIIYQKKLADLKNDFINNMTHEFKTPIATVSLATEALSEDAVQANPKMRGRYIEVIREESKRLGIQVEKVLQLASIEQEELSLKKKKVSVKELVQAAVERARFPVEEKNGSLTVEFKQEDLSIVADESHFSNAIFNLLDNAIKYSQGPPTINLTGRYDKGELKIAIEDKGIGMTKEQQRQVFDKFYRVPTGNLHDVKGFGLGLNYVKYIIEAHHGHIELDSIPGQGSTFAIIIDLSQHAV